MGNTACTVAASILQEAQSSSFFATASCSIVRLETIRNRPADCVAYSIQAKVSSVETILDSFASKGGAVI